MPRWDRLKRWAKTKLSASSQEPDEPRVMEIGYPYNFKKESPGPLGFDLISLPLAGGSTDPFLPDTSRTMSPSTTRNSSNSSLKGAPRDDSPRLASIDSKIKVPSPHKSMVTVFEVQPPILNNVANGSVEQSAVMQTCF